MPPFDPDAYLDDVRALLGNAELSRMLAVPSSGWEHASFGAWATAIAREYCATSGAVPSDVHAAFADGFGLVVVRLSGLTSRASTPEVQNVAGAAGLRVPTNAVGQLAPGEFHRLIQATLARFIRLNRAIGWDEHVIRNSPILVVGPDDVIAVRRRHPEADDRMAARALIDFPSRMHWALSAMTENYRVIRERNRELGAQLADDRLRALAAYRVSYSPPPVWNSCRREFERLAKRYEPKLGRDLVRYVAVYRSGPDAVTELDQLVESRDALRRSEGATDVPEWVQVAALRDSVDLQEAMQRVSLFHWLQFTVRSELRISDRTTVDRLAGERFQALEPVLHDATQRVTEITRLRSRLDRIAEQPTR